MNSMFATLILCAATLFLTSSCGNQQEPAAGPAAQATDAAPATVAPTAEADAAKAAADGKAAAEAAEAAAEAAAAEASAAAEQARKEAEAKAAALKEAAAEALQGKFDSALGIINNSISSGDYDGALKKIQDTLGWSDLSDTQKSTLNTLMGTVKEKLAAAALEKAGVSKETQKAAKALGGLLEKK